MDGERVNWDDWGRWGYLRGSRGGWDKGEKVWEGGETVWKVEGAVVESAMDDGKSVRRL